ncbi:MAG: hypothetical protein KA158_07395 [Leucobacter sp.]|nr:hypothetical protein [Leucobacter sp.]
MTLTALGLVLAAAVAHSIWNILAAKSSGSGVPFLFWGAVFSTLIWGIAVPFTGGIGESGPGPFLLAVVVSGALHVLYMLVLQRGYRSGELSTVYATARGSGPVLTVLVSILLFGERPGAMSLGGVALVIAGVVAFGLIGRRRSKSSGIPARTEGGRRWDPAIVFGLLTGVAIAVYTLWDVYMVNSFGLAPVAFMVGTSMAQAVVFGGMLGAQGVRSGREVGAVGPIRRMRGELRASWRRLLIFGLLSPLSYILVLTAATMAPLSLVAPMRELSVVLVGLYGALRSHENNPGLRLTAAVVVVCGVILIGL